LDGLHLPVAGNPQKFVNGRLDARDTRGLKGWIVASARGWTGARENSA